MVSLRLALRRPRRGPALEARRAALLATGLVGALALRAEAASAHAPPLGARVLADAGGGEEVVVTNRGLVFRDPETGASSLLCNEALRITTAELPGVARLDGGALLVASSSGLRLSLDRGCSWADVGGMERTHTSALAAAPSDPRTLFVASQDAERRGLLVTHDAGATWASAVETGEGDYVHSLLVAGDGSSHVYATLATYGAAAPPTHSLLRSVDGGRSWERRPLPVNDTVYAARAATADPRDPAALVLYTVANSPGLDPAHLLVSEDAGDSFEVALERPEIRGAAHDPAGQLWVAARDGLWRAASPGAGFEPTSPASELGCVTPFAGGLVVCGHYGGVEAGRSGLGLSRDGGRSFEPLLDFDGVQRPVACEPGSPTATLCEQPWRDWEAEMLTVGAPRADPYARGAGPGGDGAFSPPPSGAALPGASLDGASLDGVSPDAVSPEAAERGAPALGPPGSASCALGPGAADSGARELAGALLLLVAGCGLLRWRTPRGARSRGLAGARTSHRSPPSPRVTRLDEQQTTGARRAQAFILSGTFRSPGATAWMEVQTRWR